MNVFIPRVMFRYTLSAAALLLAAAFCGCDKPEPGPKRADHAAAHSPRYHPEVRRADTAGSPATQPMRPGAVTQPADITFTQVGSVGCPVLFVNSESFTVQDILEPILDDLAEKARSMPLPAYRNYVFRIVSNQIDYHVSLAVLYQQAKDRYTDEKQQELFDKEADRLVRDVINRRFAGITARYEAHLKALDLKMDDIKARAKRQAMVMQFLQEQFKPMAVEPSRRELLHYYQTHADEFSSPPRAQLLLIEIPLDKELGKSLQRATPEELAGARDRARAQLIRARQELDSGVDFAAVARTYSKGLRGSQGGDWGEITPNALTGRWARAGQVLFTLKENQVSDIIETDEAFFLVKCGRLTPGHTLTFEEAQEKIITRLADEEFNRRRDAYVQDLLSKATVSRRQDFFEAVIAAVPRPAALTLPSAGNE